MSVLGLRSVTACGLEGDTNVSKAQTHVSSDTEILQIGSYFRENATRAAHVTKTMRVLTHYKSKTVRTLYEKSANVDGASVASFQIRKTVDLQN